MREVGGARGWPWGFGLQQEEGIQKQAGRGLAAHKISAIPFARDREMAEPKKSATVELSVPTFIAKWRVRRRHRSFAEGPRAPVASQPNGLQFHPAESHIGLFWAIFGASAAAAWDGLCSPTANGADGRSG